MRKMTQRVVFKSIIGIIIPLVVLALVVATVGYGAFTNGMMEIYEKGAIEIANTAAAEAASASLKPRFFRMRSNSRRMSSYGIRAIVPSLTSYSLNSAKPSMA